MQERWLYDEISINNALKQLKDNGIKHTGKIMTLFHNSTHFEAINLQNELNTPDDIDLILSTMVKCKEDSFLNAIDPLEKAYEDYANHSLEVANLPSVSIDGSTNVSAQSECSETYGMAMDVFAGYTEIAERDSEHVKEIGYQLNQLDVTMAGILKNLQE